MGPSSRFAFLDGIRGVAILFVLCAHWGIERLPWGHGGYVGVDLFFVLSGFIITMLLWRSRPTPGGPVLGPYLEFVRRRGRRLYPALLGLVVVGSALCLVSPWDNLDDGAVLRNGALTAVQLSWLSEMRGVPAEPFRQTWSLGAEWLFYLLWPLVLWAAARRAWSPLRTSVWAGVGAGVLWLGSALLLRGEAFYFHPVPRASQILVGAVLALWMVHRPPVVSNTRWERLVTSAALCAVVVYVAIPPTPFGTGVEQWVGTPLATVAAVLLIRHGYVADSGWLHGLLASRPLSALGRVSYSVYLWHWIPIYLLDKDALPLPMPVLGAIGIAAVAVLSATSYRYLERPFLGSRRLGPNRSKVSPPGEAGPVTAVRSDAPAGRGPRR